MTQAVPNLPAFPVELAGPISDSVLEAIVNTGYSAQINDDLTHAGATLLFLCAPQMATELLRYRRAMEVIKDMTDLDNVHVLTPGTGS